VRDLVCTSVYFFAFVSVQVFLSIHAHIFIRFKVSITVLSLTLILTCIFVLGIHPWIMMTMIFKTRISI